ncbi:lytic transglycosylase domain-containing protein [Acidithiobacillus sp.]
MDTENPMIGLALLQQCSPEVAPVTMAAIVQAESGGWPWTINVNGLPHGSRFSTKQAAIAAATLYIRMGYKVDMGLAQIDSENLGWLGLTVRQVFNPCTNLQSAQKILIGAYRQAGADGTRSLDGTFQAYNSGNTRGDGHYARVVYHQSGVQVPAIPGGQLAPWATRQVGGGEGMGKEGGGDGSVPVQPVKSWQPLLKDEDFSASHHHHHGKSQTTSSVTGITGIWTAAR